MLARAEAEAAMKKNKRVGVSGRRRAERVALRRARGRGGGSRGVARGHRRDVAFAETTGFRKIERGVFGVARRLGAHGDALGGAQRARSRRRGFVEKGASPLTRTRWRDPGRARGAPRAAARRATARTASARRAGETSRRCSGARGPPNTSRRVCPRRTSRSTTGTSFVVFYYEGTYYSCVSIGSPGKRNADSVVVRPPRRS